MSRLAYKGSLCQPTSQDLDFCGPRSVNDAQICCKKIARAKERKCIEEETKKWELNEAKKNSNVYDMSNPYVKVTRRPILRLRRPRIG